MQHLFTNNVKPAHSKRDSQQAKTHVDHLLFQLVDDMHSILDANSFLNQAQKLVKKANNEDPTCKRGSVGKSDGLLIPSLSIRFRLKPKNSNSNGFELHRPSIKGTKLLFKKKHANNATHYVKLGKRVPSAIIT